MLAKTFSATLGGYGPEYSDPTNSMVTIANAMDASLVTIEAALQKALPQIVITGLPGEIVKESRERVCVSLTKLGYSVPSSRVVIHLSPACSRKQGSQFDLAIAVCLLAVEGYVRPESIAGIAFLGELSLDGRIRPVPAALPLIDAMERSSSVDRIIASSGNNDQASVTRGTKTLLARTLVDVLDFLHGRSQLSKPSESKNQSIEPVGFSLDDVIGQRPAKRALQISIAGRHHCLFAGPPGVGKSMLAECAPSLMPPLTGEERLECLKNYAHHSKSSFWRRPFRSPHHSISAGALLGGGSGQVIPGEVSLAHNGILFLDELPEFRKDIIEGLREPMQSGVIHLHRVGQSLSLKARFTLVAAMNPCPCGYLWDLRKRCRCPPDRVNSYRRRISGAILDRMDLMVNFEGSSQGPGIEKGLSHDEVRLAIAKAFDAQKKRYNSCLQNGDKEIGFKFYFSSLRGEEREWLNSLGETEALSFRAAGKILGVARTIADLEGSEEIRLCHLREASGLRCANLFGAR
jgi:magnesium chelatase family protein